MLRKIWNPLWNCNKTNENFLSQLNKKNHAQMMIQTGLGVVTLKQLNTNVKSASVWAVQENDNGLVQNWVAPYHSRTTRWSS